MTIDTVANADRAISATPDHTPGPNLRITLVATVRNERDTIRAFVESLLGQLLKADEIVIVDGASSDGTREILEEYALHGDIVLISRPCNIAQGRNLGIAKASCSHVAVTDAGCLVDPAWLKEIASCFLRNPRVEVVAGNFRFETHTPFEKAVVSGTFQPNRDETETARYYPSSRSVAFTKAAWQKAGGYPEWLYAAEDTLFNIRLRQIGCEFVFCREAIVRWRPRETWRALARQRINFSRGNARIGVSTAGYVTNLRVHALITALILAGIWHPVFLAFALGIFGWHVRRRLWPQAVAVTPDGALGMRLRVIAVMEFVRTVNLYGFMLGAWDRLYDPSYKLNQKQYMGVESAEGLDILIERANYRVKHLRLPHDPDAVWIVAAALVSVACAAVAWVASDRATTYVLPALIVAGVGTIALLAKSLSDYSRTGPRVRDEILNHYRRYALFAVARLGLWAFALMLFMCGGGVLVYYLLAVSLGWTWSPVLAGLMAVLGLLGTSGVQVIRKLRFNPGLLVASMHYRVSRLYALWQWSTPARIHVIQGGLAVVGLLLVVTASWQLARQNRGSEIVMLWSVLISYAGIIFVSVWSPEARALRGGAREQARSAPNILLIGSDTLRADRLGVLGYRRALTPNIDALAAQGVLFKNCYVPCARTAPSIISMLTGTWPHTHGIRDNFVPDKGVHLNVATLPQLLKEMGYRTAALSDWCGSDMGKFSFGFDYTDLPEDQWNLKFLLRQGPKDLRLFVSLFMQNRLGRAMLPELYYLGGVPLTTQIGRRARRLLSRLACDTQPFFLNVFYSTTHPPFASEWPWYTRFADVGYSGESKFAMAKLTDPYAIIRRQGAPKEEFDLDQIIDLYDGCVAQFDDEVGRMLRHLDACGLASGTIVVVYSDHGMEFFEHDTWGQGNSAVGDFSARVPLVIRDPRKPGRGPIDKVVRSIDLAPTLLELAGSTPPGSMDGVSLAESVTQGGSCPELDAYNETGLWITDMPGLPINHLRYPEFMELIEVPDRETGTLALKTQYHEIIMAAKDRMIRRGPWKLVSQPLIDGTHTMLFNVADDPGCTRNCAAEHPEITSRLSRALRDWIAAGSNTASDG